MQFVMNKGIIVTIDDDEIVNWKYVQKENEYFIRLKDGSMWCYIPDSKVFFLYVGKQLKFVRWCVRTVYKKKDMR